MQQPTLLRRGLQAVGIVLVIIGGAVFVLMLVLGLEAFLAQMQESTGAAGVFWATVALVMKLAVPALLVWMGVRCISPPERRRETW
jgi:membrane protein implicated in regulation of membrane protease activity